MIDREDLVFATCYQLAQIISADWENQPAEVVGAIETLEPIDDPSEPLVGSFGTLSNPVPLEPSEKEPEFYRNRREYSVLNLAAQEFKTIMKFSDSWETADSETIKKEIIARIKKYEERAKHITTPVPCTCNIVV